MAIVFRPWVPNGQLRVCDRCGDFRKRWTELRLQNGLWLCLKCVDLEDRRRSR